MKSHSILWAIGYCMRLASAFSFNPFFFFREVDDIDNRFPVYIVKPRPPCNEIGDFVHPRNCSWFYKCHRVSQTTIFWNEFYECAPGTIFSDKLDICIYGDWRNCRESFEINSSTLAPIVTPTLPPTPPTLEPTFTPIDTTPNNSPAPPCLDCSSEVENCDDYNVCQDGRAKESKILCLRAYENCCGQKIFKCDTSQYYDLNAKICTPKPTSPSMVCPDCKNCAVNAMNCVPYEVCTNGTEKQNKILCSTAETLCKPCGMVTPICETGQYYDMVATSCTMSPDSPEMSCDASPPTETTDTPPPPPPPTTTPPPTPPPTTHSTTRMTTTSSPIQLVDEQYSIQCSIENEIPHADWIKRTYCNSLALCSSIGQFQGTKVLCSEFYRCIQVPEGWDARLDSCPDNLIYDYVGDACIEYPTNVCQL